jgi:hypothetical protein
VRVMNSHLIRYLNDHAVESGNRRKIRHVIVTARQHYTRILRNRRI